MVEKTSSRLLIHIIKIRIKDSRRNYQYDLNTILIKQASIGTLTKQLTVVGLKIQFINLNILFDKIRINQQTKLLF